jgi:hypothetical protein
MYCTEIYAYCIEMYTSCTYVQYIYAEKFLVSTNGIVILYIE